MHGSSGRLSLSAFLDSRRRDLRVAIGAHHDELLLSTDAPGLPPAGTDRPRADAALVSSVWTVASGGSLSDKELEHLIELRDSASASLPAMPLTVRARLLGLIDAATQAHSIEWKRRIAMRLGELEGEVIERWSGIEMALRDDGLDGDPQFSDPVVPFLQLSPLDIEHSGGRLRVMTYQGDDGFGLWCTPAVEELRVRSGIFRTVHELALPRGRVAQVDVTVEDGIIVEVMLHLDVHQVLLLAGEVEEGWEGELHFVRFDESVLVFRDAIDADGIEWRPPRRA